MGYSHYWRYDVRRIGSSAYRLAVADVKTIIASTTSQYRLVVDASDDNITIAGPAGATCETFTVFTSRRAMERAVILRRLELRRQLPRLSKVETFARARFDSCRTAQHPYDDVVTACLCVLAGAGLPVESAGKRDEWELGRRLAANLLARAIVIPTGIEERRDEEAA